MSDAPATPWTGVGMDPRLRARRVAVMRAAGRRRLHRLMALASVAALVATAMAVSYSPAVAVHAVTVRVDGALDEAELRAVADIGTGTSLVWLDTAEAEARLEALPGVADARVERVWPHDVVVEVTARQAAAVVPDGAGGWVQVDADGLVLGPAPQRGSLVPLEGVVTVGAPGTLLDPTGVELAVVAAALPASLVSRVRAVATSDLGPLLRLEPSGVVLLRSTDELSQKYLAALSVLAHVADARVEVLDVGVPDAPVLRRAAT